MNHQMNNQEPFRIAIIGGGAAGFFLASNIQRTHPNTRIVIFEKSSRVLAKVKVSGGGRCNLTNSFHEIKDLIHAYPRGHRLLKKLFKGFNHEDAYQWFEDHGVELVTQDDECVFPLSQNSESVILCLQRAARQNGVEIRTRHELTGLKKQEDGRWKLQFNSPEKEKEGEIYSEKEEEFFDRVAITTGGSPTWKGLTYLKELGHKIEEPIPSLFTFNIQDPTVNQLMGIVVEKATAFIPGTKFRSQGPLLFTHWGMSGPAILKLSSYAARMIHETEYRFPLQINWVDESNTEIVQQKLKELSIQNAQKKMSSIRPFNIPIRLWDYLIVKAGFSPEKKWGELGKKGLNKLTTLLTSDDYQVDGKGSFREEFVTCGGVSLDSVSHKTLESKVCPGLFFAGEILDVDAITGGFNFQAAWTTAYTVAQYITQ